MKQPASIPEPIRAEIDLTRIAANTRILERHARGAELMAVVKANAYGHGAVDVARVCLAHGASWLGVARLSEAVALRREGIEAPILILGYTAPEGVQALVEYNLCQTILDGQHALALSEKAKGLQGTLHCHIKVDTGMGRVGFDGFNEETCTQEIQDTCALPGLRADGIFTHFATADEADQTFAREQLGLFLRISETLKQNGHPFSLRHGSNSGGILTLPEASLDMVRGGITLYGLNPSCDVRADLKGIRPAMSFKSTVVQVKTVAKGRTISYGATWVAPRESVIATVACGYGDGYHRCLTDKGRMLIRGASAPIVGRVCMDMTMLDVTQIPGVVEGDEVVMIGTSGRESISVDEIAAAAGTINYEVTCQIGNRVPRVYR